MKVVFSQAMVAPVQGYSPSAAKPAVVMAAWREAWPNLETKPAQPATLAELYRAHDRDYVDDVLALRVPSGFGTRSAEVNASLMHTSGAMLTAARWAVAEGGPVAAPVSGFHHAGWESGEGFCTFNGLMVTALAMQADHPGLRIGILDYDYHYGNGTVDIIEKLRPPNLVHITAGERFQSAEDAPYFMAAIAQHLEQLAECNLVIYQAGADPHIDDPLGGFLSTTPLAQRDWQVFDGLRRLGVPVAWNLAGGYQKPLSKVVAIHENTMRACLAAHQ